MNPLFLNDFLLLNLKLFNSELKSIFKEKISFYLSRSIDSIWEFLILISLVLVPEITLSELL